MAALIESPDGLWRAEHRDRRRTLARLSAVRELRSSERLQLGGTRRGHRRFLPLLPPESRHSRSFQPSAIRSPGSGSRSPSAACCTRCWASGCRWCRRTATATGLAFEFLEDSTDGDAKRVLTGHDNGLITINIAEADDVHREKQRTLQKEPYRTLLGHFRHEIGHYFWDRLILNGPQLEAFRALFGDERADYQEALRPALRRGTAGALGTAASSAPTPPCIRGKIGRNPGPTTCTWSMRSKRPAPPGLALRPKRADEPQHAAAARSPQSEPPGLRRHDRVLALAHLRAEQS